MTYKVIYESDEIGSRVAIVANQINRDYAGREIDIVCLTNAAMPFTSDLMRLLAITTRLHLMAFISYSPAPMTGEVRVTLDVSEPLHGRHVLVVEGMVISGRTPLYLMNLLRQRQPETIELCAIGSKPGELAVELPIKYRLFEIGREWVAGYGIGKGPERTLPYLIDTAARS